MHGVVHSLRVLLLLYCRGCRYYRGCSREEESEEVGGDDQLRGRVSNVPVIICNKAIQLILRVLHVLFAHPTVLQCSVMKWHVPLENILASQLGNGYILTTT